MRRKEAHGSGVTANPGSDVKSWGGQNLGPQGDFKVDVE